MKYLNDNALTLFDKTLGDFCKPLFVDEGDSSMRTDIKEFKDKYEMEIEMPGFDKKDISVNLEDGYLTVCAKKENSEKEDKDGLYLKKERIVSCSRSYYVGELNEEDIKAKYENGLLKLDFPKYQEKVPEKKRIAIE